MIFSPGYKIGAYTIVRPLGQGGMGDVYEVVHEQLGTHYALKTFSCDYEEAEALQKKFFEEGRLLSKLTHPRIVRVFDLAVEPKSQMPYFVMDLVLYEDGESHTVEDVEKSDITENLVYLWFKDVVEALDYIHSQGIVHRDIKPSNLLLNPDYHVTLTDFGVSRIFGEKIVREVDASRTMASKTGRGKLVLGTEHYIAPEVAQGEEATPAADAYALGMMCFRLLTGVWYEPDSDALSLLSKYKLRWMAVLPQLLSPHAEKRPKELYRLKEHLKGTAQLPANVQPKNKPKPRKKFDVVRFGMTTLATHMLMAYYTRGADSRELFKDKKIYADPSFERHFGQYNVIHLRMTDFVAGGIDAMMAPVLKALKESEKCLKAILAGDAETVAALVERCHQENTSVIRYNDENSLACVVSLALYAARNRYLALRELPSGKGYADIAFLPRPGQSVPAIVVELKAEESASIAIDQIRRREYPEALKGYAGEMVLVGINYRTDPANPGYKHHTCAIERWAY